MEEKERLFKIINKYKDIPNIVINDIHNALKIHYFISKRNILYDPYFVRIELSEGKLKDYNRSIVKILDVNYLDEYGVFLVDTKDVDRYMPTIIINPKTEEIILILYDEKKMIGDDYAPLIYIPQER